MARPKTYVETPEGKRERIRIYQRAWAKENRDKIRAYGQKAGKKHREKKRDFIYEFKSNPCVDCSVSYSPVVMDFHHRRDEEKCFDLCSQSWSRSKESILKEIAKCDLLCANCHWIRHLSEGTMGKKNV